MMVSLVQQHFLDLTRLLAGAEAKKVVAEFERIAAGLEPFRDKSIAEFADFLVKAEEYHRTGILPIGKQAKAPAKPKAPKVDMAAVIAGLKLCDEQASHGKLNADELQGFMTMANALTVAQLKTVAADLGLPLAKSATKPKIVDSIRKSIEERHGSALRTQMIHPPAEPHEETLA